MAERQRILGAALAIAMLAVGCGYRIHGAVGKLPSGIQSIGIPTFRNSTNQYKIEQMITSAVLREFSIRTRVPVNSSSSGVDAVLIGEIGNVSSVPATFGSQTFGSAFLVSVQMSVKLVNLKDSTVIWQKPDFLYRERYVLNSTVRDFFSEENPALERLARDFAKSLASTILESR
jgi:hypothetical protein